MFNRLVVQEGFHDLFFSLQFIIGLGIPVDLKEQSVTVGTVIKFQYDLPTNSSEYTSRIYGFANTVSRDMAGDVATDEDEAKGNKLDANKYRDFHLADNSTSDDRFDNDNDTLVDITFDDRRKRSLLYSEGGLINDIEETDSKTEISLEEALRRQELLDRKREEENPEPQRMNRWDFYKVIEHMIERYVLMSLMF